LKYFVTITKTLQLVNRQDASRVNSSFDRDLWTTHSTNWRWSWY